MADPALKIQGLTVAYHSKPVLWNVDLTVAPRVLMGIIGPNGAGKSTLLKATLGLIPRLTGQVSVFGAPYNEKKQQIGYVPQRASIDWDFPTTVYDLVMMGTYGRLGWFRRPGAKEKKATEEALERVELTPFARRQISELSGGQQQRAFLARAFAQDTPIYFLDEPFAGVDVKTEKAIVKMLHGMRDDGKTILVVQHDLTTVGEYLDEVTLLNREIIASGPVADAFELNLIEKTYGGTLPRSNFGQANP
ncbi:MAG: metal ABC transporter ATP-binding protein [Planctomycetota bacterium]